MSDCVHVGNPLASRFNIGVWVGIYVFIYNGRRKTKGQDFDVEELGRLLCVGGAEEEKEGKSKDLYIARSR